MLNKNSPKFAHIAQNASLIFISLLFLPLDTFVLFLSYALRFFRPSNVARRKALRAPDFYPKTILVTGVGMSKGLAIARAFYQAGHRVIGADFEPNRVPVNGRFSVAIYRFYKLSKPDDVNGASLYIRGLLDIVQREKVDLWVSCSGVASAVEDGQAMETLERKTGCKAIQFNVKTTATLHEKDTFIQYTREIGLPVPETHNVMSRNEVHQVLNKAKKKHYIMKSVGVDDAVRGDMTLLPRRTMSQTYSHVSEMRISKDRPWVLQQFIKGEEYCTHAIIIQGEVLAFVACPSSELLMHYEALPQESGLSRAMLQYTREYAERSGRTFTGHLSFDFLVEDVVTEKGLERHLLPIECNPRAHTAVVLFEKSFVQMAQVYLTALRPLTNGDSQNFHDSDETLLPQPTKGYYWIGHDIISYVFHPLLRLLLLRIGFAEFLNGLITFSNHVLSWKDGTYELWDPLPWWMLYHVYWPGQFLSSILEGRRWSRVNVSTTKMFGL